MHFPVIIIIMMMMMMMMMIIIIISLGPFRVMTSAPAGLEEVIKYADFKQETTVEDVDDDSTLEDELDEEDLEDIIFGNIRLNVSRILVVPDGELVRFLYRFIIIFSLVMDLSSNLVSNWPYLC